jgi:carboxymethylenebutenolidase
MSEPVAPPPIPDPEIGTWVVLPPEVPDQPALRCWWALPPTGTPRGGVLVLPEVFGINGWVRSVAGRLARVGYAALAVPLFGRTAPELELGYDEADLRRGRSHKERTTTPELLSDLERAGGWLQRQLPSGRSGVGCVGFCFGGHVALLAATLPGVRASCDFYGAGVAIGRPGGGPPSLELLPQVRGRLLCICGSEDALIPPSDVEAIEAALRNANHARGGETAHRLLVLEGGHGFLCEARSDYRPAAAARGWQEMLAFFSMCLEEGAG